MADKLDIEALESQMNSAVGELTRLQQQVEAKKEYVNKLDGAIWALKMERESADAECQDSDGISKVATTAED
mgnify:CR=1 FL=1